MDPFIGEVRAFAFQFAPPSWMPCNGQLLNIAQNATLYAILGNFYGGDGRTTFALPNLNGTLPVGTGQMPGGNINWTPGATNGSSTVTLGPDQLAAHNHSFNATTNEASNRKAPNQQLALASVDDGSGESIDVFLYSTGNPDTQLANGTLSAAGGGQQHNNMMPYLTMIYYIAVRGLWPDRP